MAVSIHGNNGLVTTNGTAAAPSLAAPDTDTGLYFGTNLIHATTNGTERLRIKSDGTINITTANGNLEWTASSGSNPFIRSVGSGQQSLEFNTGGDERLRITSTGRLGIGEDSPDSLLHIKAGNDRSAIRLENTADTPDNVWEIIPAISGVSNTGFCIRDVTDSANRLVINGSGKVGINETTPEEILDLGEANQQNLKVGQRGYLGQAYSTSATILGHSVKAKTTGTTAGGMEVTETNSGGGAPSAIRMESGTIQFHTAGSGTSGAAFDSEKVRIASDGHVRIQHATTNGKLILSRNVSVTSTNTSIGVVDFACNTAHTVQARLMGKTLGTSNVGGDLVIETRANGGSLDERVRFTGEGEVLIGRSAWGSNLHPNDINRLVVVGTSPADSFDSQCHLEGSETSGAANTGGALAFAGHDGSQYRNWANIYGMKENGTGGNVASYIAFHTRAAGGSPAEKVRITSRGRVNIGESNLTQTATSLNVTRNSGGTVAGESVIAATCGDDTTMVSALLTVRNAGNRGSKGHSSGSKLASFEFNDGSALAIDKNGKIGIGIAAPNAMMQIISDQNAETDRFNSSNYHLMLQNTGNDTGEAVGMGFAISDDTDKVGAAILHERSGGGSAGSLQFYTNSDGASVTERLRIESDGYVHMYRNAFCKMFLNSTGTQTIAQGAFEFTMANGTYNSFNVGGHYKTSGTDAWKFVCPVSGYYHFHFQSISQQNITNAWMAIRRNGSYVNRTHWTQGGNWDQQIMSTVISANSGDKIDFYNHQSCSFYGQEWTWMTIMKIA